MPNIRIQNTSPNIRNQSTNPNARISAGSQSVTTQGAQFGGKGYLIGMMAMTYTIPHNMLATTTGGQGQGPNIRISNI